MCNLDLWMLVADLDLFSVLPLCLCGEDGKATLTTKTQRTQRKHREELT
jgi:hypothetical protein